MTLFGFTQLEFAGALPVADGRYVIRDGSEERVLVVETAGAPAPPRRRRRRPREAGGPAPKPLPLARITAIRAFAPFATEEEAGAWLKEGSASHDSIDELLAEGVDLINRALHAHAVACGDPYPQALTLVRAVAARIGYGSGEEVAVGEFTDAREVEVHADSASRRRQRTEELRPQERVAAVLGGRERLDACETLVLRARADLDAGRRREAALQLRVGLEALLVELKGALAGPDHERDMEALAAGRRDAGELANQALHDDLNSEQLNSAREILELCERVLRRRRVLGG